MTTRHDVATRRTTKRSPIAALALMALAVAALTAGCVQDHDPRNDSSRSDGKPRAIPAVSTHNETV
jgi:hypothetical protein